MRKIMFLFPESTGERLGEDGFFDALLELDIDYLVREFGRAPLDLSKRYAAALCRHGCDLIVYPELTSSIFTWHSANVNWFHPEDDEIGIV